MINARIMLLNQQQQLAIMQNRQMKNFALLMAALGAGVNATSSR